MEKRNITYFIGMVLISMVALCWLPTAPISPSFASFLPEQAAFTIDFANSWQEEECCTYPSTFRSRKAAITPVSEKWNLPAFSPNLGRFRENFPSSGHAPLSRSLLCVFRI